MSTGQILSVIFSSSTVLAQVLLVVLVVLVITNSRHLALIKKHALAACLLVALVATVGSLMYSELAGYEPCKLCWYQRILMYPLVVLFGAALWKKDHSIFSYGMIFSALGMLLSAYHYLLQLGLVPSAVCNALGSSVSCSQRFAMEYGYITIPMMALTSFALIFVISWVGRKKIV